MASSSSNPNPNPNPNANLNNNEGLHLKLLIDTQNKRVLFAEANKDFVDFLFTIFSLPIATVINILSSNSMGGSLGKLYQSIENFNPSYLQPNLNKETILNPIHHPLLKGISLNPLFFPNSQSKTKTAQKLYMCPSPRYGYGGINEDEYELFGNNGHRSHRYVSDDPQAQCPQCHSKISTEVTFVATDKSLSSASASASGGKGSEGGGYVKGGVTYMVMDDLQVKPLSLVSSLSMLSTFNVKDNGALEEKVVSVGVNEGLKLLRASLETETVLTDVFLKQV